MILVAGGQLDPNIGALLRTILRTGAPFRDLLVGPDLRPRLSIDLAGNLALNGEAIRPRACFVRHDVFLAEKMGRVEDQRAALNWFHAIRGWAQAQTDVRLLNRHSRAGDEGKYQNLVRAQRHGLSPPQTCLCTHTAGSEQPRIRKPVAGGELTELVGEEAASFAYPYLVQPRLLRPELRLYRVGDQVFGFSLASPDLDYRERQQVTVREAAAPDDLARRFVGLAEELGLDFAAADFMQDGDGRWSFLEINSQPMFAAFDRVVEGRLTEALVTWLLADAEEPAVVSARGR